MSSSWQTLVGLSLLAPDMYDRHGNTKMSQQRQAVGRFRAALVNRAPECLINWEIQKCINNIKRLTDFSWS